MTINEPEELHSWEAEGKTWRVVSRQGNSIVEIQEPRRPWIDADDHDAPNALDVVAAELVRLAAENAELVTAVRAAKVERDHLRDQIDAYEAMIEESAMIQATTLAAERDNLRECYWSACAEQERLHVEGSRLLALVGKMRVQLAHRVVCRSQHLQASTGWTEYGECTCGVDALLADPDGQAAAEWLEAEKAKAAEPWKAGLAQLVAALPRCGECDRPATKAYVRGGKRWCDTHAPADCPDYPRATALRSDGAAALAWLADRKAKARAEGRAEGDEEIRAQLQAYIDRAAADGHAEALAAGRRQGLAEAAELCLTGAIGLDLAASALLEAFAEEIRALAEEGGK